MDRTKALRAGMREALHLVRRGSLSEATAAIQRTLSGLAPNAASDTATAAKKDAPLEGNFRVIETHARPFPGAAGAGRARAHTPAPHFRPLRRPHPWGHTEPMHRPAPERARDVEPGGRFISGSYADRAGTRAYKLYLPSDYRGQALPLVVMLHGCTQDPDDFAAGTRMNVLAEEHKCFVLYPAQTKAANASGCWNWFQARDQQRDQGEPSIIAGLTRDIIRTYAIDAHRVYVAGLSAGGAMAAVMGNTYPDLYAAVGVHSGLPYAAAHDLPSAFAAMNQMGGPARRARSNGAATAARFVPTIVFHGDRDTTVHPRNGDEVVAQCTTMYSGNRADTPATEPKVTIRQGRVPDGHAYTRAVYQDANGQTILEQWRIHGAGHAWSGGNPRGSYTDPKGPNAAREMIRFFYQHARDRG